eukprot:TRINITY_DN1011_c0_g3_i1.p1 TRINITY_DN1011_c0_g3~~TRINITY_DN1011_c0_g3_i1.p1  ORF type:complete len:453 (+),score=169.85 TRINITY_DN1011_c0_g3_i1:109-1467(+)
MGSDEKQPVVVKAADDSSPPTLVHKKKKKKRPSSSSKSPSSARRSSSKSKSSEDATDLPSSSPLLPSSSLSSSSSSSLSSSPSSSPPSSSKPASKRRSHDRGERKSLDGGHAKSDHSKSSSKHSSKRRSHDKKDSKMVEKESNGDDVDSPKERKKKSKKKSKHRKLAKEKTQEEMEVDIVLKDLEVSAVKVTKDYKVLKEVGRGNFSVVMKAKDKKTKQFVAIKVIKKSTLKNGVEDARKEAHILTNLEHPNIIQLYECREDSKNFYLIMELVEGKEMFDMIVDRGCYSEKEARNVIAQVTSAIKYMHGMNFAHRDLKPENVLCTVDKDGNEVAKVADFGASKASEEMQTRIGTPQYVAPEVLESKTDLYSDQVDMWSIGCIAYTLLAGAFPFEQPRLFNKIIACDYDMNSDHWDTISDGAKSFIKALLVKDPGIRLTPQQVLDHPWIKGEI